MAASSAAACLRTTGLSGLLLTLVLLQACAAGNRLRIGTRNDASEERATRADLQRIIAAHDVQGWIFTRDIMIERGAIPHSHPVLTLGTWSGSDDAKLASFLHEQFHWYLEQHPGQREAAITDFAALFPDAPSGGSEGARNRYSSWLHLIVCDMELQAMTELIGSARARALLRRTRHYTWIYAKVLDDPRVREIDARHGLLLPPR